MACEHGSGLEVLAVMVAAVERVGIGERGGCYGVVVAGVVVVGGVEAV
jgi:hypothetical protein